MKYYLAAYDMGYRSAMGNYWVFHHASLSATALSQAYDAVRESDLPKEINQWSYDFVKGGFCRLDKNWFLAYRFYNGGRDQFNRPHRWVLLCAFIKANEATGMEGVGIIKTGLFDEWSHRPVSLPAPIPDLLDGNLDAKKALPRPDLVKRVESTGKLDDLDVSEAAGIVCFSSENLLMGMSIAGTSGSLKASVWKRTTPATPVKPQLVSRLEPIMEPHTPEKTELGPASHDNVAGILNYDKWLLLCAGVVIGFILAVLTHSRWEQYVNKQNKPQPSSSKASPIDSGDHESGSTSNFTRNKIKN